jgi:hypothetical protein
MDPPGAGIQAILDELGKRFARIRLTQRQPPDELEGIMNAEPAFFGVGGELFRAFSSLAFGRLGVGHPETVPQRGNL